ncbi:hypothetical protein TNCV_1205951 [Trichonephila clavipes]|nr:hypothetical protein TNCV_1205951 [Trichonephila clavipes]
MEVRVKGNGNQPFLKLLRRGGQLAWSAMGQMNDAAYVEPIDSCWSEVTYLLSAVNDNCLLKSCADIRVVPKCRAA